MNDFDVQATLRGYLRAKLAKRREMFLTSTYSQREPSLGLKRRDTSAEDELAGLDHQIRQMKADIRRRDGRRSCTSCRSRRLLPVHRATTERKCYASLNLF